MDEETRMRDRMRAEGQTCRCGGCGDELRPDEIAAHHDGVPYCQECEDAPSDPGEIDWESESVACYVVTFPADDEDGATDVLIHVGRGEDGRWYLRTSDDAGGSDEAPEESHATREEAVTTAEALATERDESEEGEDAEALLVRRRHDRIGEPDPRGVWCVWWDTACDGESGVVERYATEDQARAAAEEAEEDLRRTHPGDLLCGHEVRHLERGTWRPIREDGKSDDDDDGE